MTRALAIAIASFIAAACAWDYMITVNPGDEAEGSMAVLAAVSAGGWVYFVFPKMGRSRLLDLGFILVAFPIVGMMTGLIGGPIGVFIGAYVAITLPFVDPYPATLLYMFGAFSAWILPRLEVSFFPPK